MQTAETEEKENLFKLAIAELVRDNSIKTESLGKPRKAAAQLALQNLVHKAEETPAVVTGGLLTGRPDFVQQSAESQVAVRRMPASQAEAGVPAVAHPSSAENGDDVLGELQDLNSELDRLGARPTTSQAADNGVVGRRVTAGGPGTTTLSQVSSAPSVVVKSSGVETGRGGTSMWYG